MKLVIVISSICIFFGCKEDITFRKYETPKKQNVEKTLPLFCKGEKIDKTIILLSNAFWIEQELFVEAKNALGEIMFRRTVNEHMKKDLDAAIQLLVDRFCQSDCEITFDWYGGHWSYEAIRKSEHAALIGVWSEEELIKASFEEKINDLKYTPKYQDLNWEKKTIGLYDIMIGHAPASRKPVDVYEYSTPKTSFFKEHGTLYYFTGSSFNGYPIRKKTLNISLIKENGNNYLLVEFEGGISKSIRDSFSKQEIELINLFKYFN